MAFEAVRPRAFRWVVHNFGSDRATDACAERKYSTAPVVSRPVRDQQQEEGVLSCLVTVRSLEGCVVRVEASGELEE